MILTERRSECFTKTLHTEEQQGNVTVTDRMHGNTCLCISLKERKTFIFHVVTKLVRDTVRRTYQHELGLRVALWSSVF